MKTYIEKLSDKKKSGCILFCVCRGKISEGFDFSDDLARAVVLVGVPYPPAYDKKVEYKKGYLDQVYENSKLEKRLKIKGQDWYFQQAVRAMNQSIGRVIRHVNDYGAIFLCDARFASQHIHSQIAEWILPELKNWNDFGELLKDCNLFFRPFKFLNCSQEESKPSGSSPFNPPGFDSNEVSNREKSEKTTFNLFNQ